MIAILQQLDGNGIAVRLEMAPASRRKRVSPVIRRDGFCAKQHVILAKLSYRLSVRREHALNRGERGGQRNISTGLDG